MNNDDAFDEDELAAQADEHFEQEAKQTSTLCPLSGKPVEEHEIAYHFPGRPDAYFPKQIAGRTMSPADYAKILAAGNEGVEFGGFFSKTKNKSFTAYLRFDPARVYNNESAPGVELFFPTRKVVTTSTVCPISGEPVTEGEKSYRFPGCPEYRAWREIVGRKMTAEEHAQILRADGQAVRFEGFRSKKSGRIFSAGLALRSKTGEKDGKAISWKEAAFDFGVA